MRALAAVVVLLALAAPAWADHLEPKRQIRAADQARAKAMLLRQSDLPSFKKLAPSTADPHLTCGPDQSDLTVTGDAGSPTWSATVVFVTSSATVYATRSDAAKSWRQGSSAVGRRCLRNELAREFAKVGARVSSLRPLAFPALAQRSAAYRLTLTAETQGQTLTVTLDAVVLMQGRALATVVVGTAFAQPDLTADVKLARTVAGRMQRAMRGA